MRRFGVAVVALTGCLIDNPVWLGAGSESSSDTDDGPDPAAFGCDPRPGVPGDAIDVEPEDASQLPQIIANAAEGSTIALGDGTYDLAAFAPLVIEVNGLTLRSASGDPGGVVLDGGSAETVIMVLGNDVEIAELRVTGGVEWGIFIDGADRVSIYRAQFVDTGIKSVWATPGFDRVDYADRGTVGCSTFRRETPLPLEQCAGDTALEVEGGEGWSIFGNRFERYGCNEFDQRPTMLVDGGSRDSVIVRNLFMNCPRAMLLGHDPTDDKRSWPDAECLGTGPWGHVGGVVANNMAWVGDPQIVPDSMFSFWDACDVRAYHNTAVLLGDGFHGIEHRFDTTSATLVNNLTNATIDSRDASQAIVEGNIAGASLDDFEDAFSGDLHLVAGAAAVGQALTNLGGIDIGPDIDGDMRDAQPDVGADERSE